MDILIKEQIELLEEDLKILLPMTKEQEVRLNEKFELEFNYNSNHIEGNTLTYTETKQFLQFDETGGNHTGREYDEMRASEVAIELVKELAADKERPLTETFIKNLNQVLLVRPYWKEAMTPDGQNTRRKILIGEYKAQPNSVLLENGKMFDYASPAETPILMHELLDWFRNEEEKKELSPIELSALLHYKFVCIHPFDDGNGRISRLLMNYVLYKNDFPPIIIKTDDKNSYRRALHDADSGNVESFVNYIADQLIWSLQLSIKAAKNESLEEDQDWKKELSVLIKDLDRKDGIQELKSIEVLVTLISEKLYPLFNDISKHLAIVRDLFLKFDIQVYEGNNRYRQTPITDETVSKFFYDQLNAHMLFEHFRKNGINTFNTSIEISFKFYNHYYEVIIENNKLLNKFYHQNFTRQDIETISNECGKILLAKIEEQLNSSV